MHRFALPALLLAAACTPVGPSTDPAAPYVPAAYVSGAAPAAGAVAPLAWWGDLRDPTLTTLIERGLAQNLDIRTALARIAQAQAQARATGLASDVSGTLTASDTAAGVRGLSRSETAQATLGASLVLDLFGASQRGREAALAQLQAAQLDAGTARLAYLSALTGDYATARYNQLAASLARQSLTNRERTLSLVNDRAAQGLASDLELAQAQASVDDVRAAIPAFDANFEAAVYGMATLLAEPAAPLMAQMRQNAGLPRVPATPAAGQPVELLYNRPDVASARQSLVAALANVGVAEAALLPSVSLSGSITRADATSWSFGPSLSLPLLNQPRLRAARDASLAQAEQARLSWQAAVLDAVEEVQRAQSGLRRARQVLAARQSALDSTARVASLTRSAWEAGSEPLTNLIDADIATASARSAVAAAQRDVLTQWIALQLATGRGWAPTP